MKPGDLILINGEEDARRMLELLNSKNIGAVVVNPNYKYIRITSVPEEGGSHGRSKG